MGVRAVCYGGECPIWCAGKRVLVASDFLGERRGNKNSSPRSDAHC